MPAKTAFPSEASVKKWEETYAGPATKKLEEKFAGEEASYYVQPALITSPDYHRKTIEARRAGKDKHCIVCKENTAEDVTEDNPVYFCKTCPRVAHKKCLDLKREQDDYKCALCRRRGWHIIDPVFTQSQPNELGMHGDDLLMVKAARKIKWDRGFRESSLMRDYGFVHDDGSVESDRRLLMRMKIVKLDDMEGNTLTQEMVDANT